MLGSKVTASQKIQKIKKKRKEVTNDLYIPSTLSLSRGGADEDREREIFPVFSTTTTASVVVNFASSLPHTTCDPFSSMRSIRNI